ncbi:nonspecific lipid-transfer protein [Cordyceps fumosorosea ARSEF 2679]|uniref:propanoyl-CoA C-acyltransferase n=1 Tax=Cordyceps fumosorosea (strain ARSEF 2679) TaxID=1081104 RepID=A0A167RLS2_CORFA|nr:nonspecific lipid-transfer protein [Cordyceps fumosorosea ARSEF 2679]OAA58720.1 nonspecific lipid-transfer protein [Cordyceps fumosorosea ARSEF 2679]
MSPPEKSPVYVLGVGMTQFIKPRGLRDYPELGYEAGIKAMLDAQINYDDVQTGIACFNYGDSTCGQRVFYQFGMTGIPIINTGNACATGSAGLYLARTMIQAGALDCVLVIGFEKMEPGAIKDKWPDRARATQLSRKMMEDTYGKAPGPPNAQYFGNAGREYMERYGAKPEDFAEIARIGHEHSQRNPYAQFRQAYSLQEILDSPMIYPPLTKLQCSPTSDGAAAAVLVSQRFLDTRAPHLRPQAVLMAGQALTTDSPALFSGSAIQLVGDAMTRRAVAAALREAQTSIEEVRVCELHDCFSANALVLLDGLGFSAPGRAHELIRRGGVTYGPASRVVVNPSGGLVSKGHPLGATGLAQCAELVWQLRGWAGERLLDGGVRVALQHNLGLGGAAVVTVYKRADGGEGRRVRDDEVARGSWLGYNAAVEARGFTEEEAARVRSRKARSEFALSDTQKKIEARL